MNWQTLHGFRRWQSPHNASLPAVAAVPEPQAPGANHLEHGGELRVAGGDCHKHPEPLATKSRDGDFPPDHAGILAGYRREPEQPHPTPHRGRRPGADQCTGACRSRLGQDAGVGAPHRLPGACEAREPSRHPRTRLQPARRGRDSPPVWRNSSAMTLEA